jgi:organic radical activating enzyme
MKVLLEAGLTNACVSACPYCVMGGYAVRVPYDKYRNALGGAAPYKYPNYLGAIDLVKFVRQMQNEHPEGLVVALTGGEPMAHPSFESIAGHLKSMGCAVAVYSNLKLLNDNRIKILNEHCDYLVAGYHPSELAYCFMREKGARKTMDDFGAYGYTTKEWLKEQLDKLSCMKAVNYVVGAYKDDSLEEFESWAQENNVSYVKTPSQTCEHGAIGKNGIHLQLGNAPDICCVRPDGTIIKCNGKPDVVGNIHEDGYDREAMLCKSNCPLCPSYYCFLGFGHLFASKQEHAWLWKLR